jgi:hypothetical protein
LVDFGKSYGSAQEYERREGIFYENLLEIMSHNSRRGVSFRKVRPRTVDLERHGRSLTVLGLQGLNQFTDMSREEFRKRSLGYKVRPFFSELAC